MTLLLGLLVFVVILATLILVHELGHFAMAKLFGVRVQEFGLGFPPRVIGWEHGGTIYSVNAIPLGGFVRMEGENGEAAEPDSFGAKPPWQRVIILMAGASMNILLAVAIFFFAFLGGSPRGLTVVTAVSAHSPASAAGLRTGDRILAVDGVLTPYYDQLVAQIASHQGHPVTLTVQRGSSDITLRLVPRAHPPVGQGPIGIALNDTVTVSYGPRQALRQSLGTVGSMVAAVPLTFQMLFTHGGQGVTGPIGIAHMTTNVVHNEPKEGIGSLLAFAALLSANLGVLNLLPIPALDGGRIVFALLSWLRRRNLDPQVEGMVHLVGMALLVLIILVVSYQDLIRWVTGAPY